MFRIFTGSVEELLSHLHRLLVARGRVHLTLVESLQSVPAHLTHFLELAEAERKKDWVY